MDLDGSRAFNSKSLLATRQTGLDASIDSAVMTLLRDAALTNEELEVAVIERLRLEPLKLVPPDWGEPQFHMAYDPAMIGLEPVYSFRRDIPYTGTPCLWKQAPYKGYDPTLRIGFSPTGERFFMGTCIKVEQANVDRKLLTLLSGIEAMIGYMEPEVSRYNHHLLVAMRSFIKDNAKKIDEFRGAMEKA